MKQISEELLLTLGERDQLSLFYGTLSRKDQVLRFLNLGGAMVLYSDAGGAFQVLPHQGGPISKSSGLPAQLEGELYLAPESRLVLLSEGFVTELGGDTQISQLLSEFREKESVDSLNELVFRVKSKMKSQEDMPTRDCTAVILDTNSRVIQLTKQEQDAN